MKHGNTVPSVQRMELEEKELTRAKNAAYRFLTYRPRSRKELEDRLGEREFSEDIILSVIDHCVRLGYIDDVRFAAQWAADRVRSRGYGRRRIERELREKGIDSSIVRQAIAGVLTPDIESETAEKAAAVKLKGMKSCDRDTRHRRLAGFLERKGFPYDVIRAVVKKSDFKE